MKTKIIRICFFISLMSTGALAQQNVFYNHYYINPILYNPSYIAPSGYTELDLNYRKQWSGIDGAPVTMTMNVHLPLNHKMGIAFTAMQDEAGLIKTTQGLASFSYRVYLGQSITDIHTISFGLSAGVINSRIDADEADDVNDPVLGNNTTSMDGKFGLHYQHNGLKVGFAIPRLFETSVASEESFSQEGMAPLSSTISSIGYEFKLGSRVAIEPMATYRTFENLDPQFEGLASLKLTNIGWIGGSYRQDYGAAAFFGFNILEKYKVAYAYEFATEQTESMGDGTHELQLILRLGKKQHTKPTVHQTPTHPTEQHAEVKPEETKPAEVTQQQAIDPVVETVAPVVAPVVAAPVVAEVVTPPADPHKVETAKQPVRNVEGGNLTAGHYVVVGAFANVLNAKNYQNMLKKSGYPAHVSFHPEKGYFIVHMDNVATLDEARALRDKYRQMSRYSFRDTWILTVE